MKEKLKDLTQEYLKERLIYDPDTGIFTWKESLVCHFKDGKRQTASSICQMWNKRFSNKNAGNNKQGYIIIGINGKNYAAHRLAFLYMEGYFPENFVDHIDQNPSNNAWSNLREVSNRCNLQNCKVYNTNKSGVTGVSWSDSNKRWLVNIGINNKQKHLGTYKNFDDAVMVRYNEEQSNINWNCSIESSAEKYLKENNLI